MRVYLLGFLSLAIGACGAPVGRTSRPPAPLELTPADADAAARGLSASVDPRAGLVLVARLEDASDGEGPPLPQSGLRCGQAIDEVAASLSDYVSSRLASGEPVVWECAWDRCELRGMMEFDPTRVLRFGRDAGGSLVVTGLDLFEDVGSEDIRAQLDAEHASLRGSCL